MKQGFSSTFLGVLIHIKRPKVDDSGQKVDEIQLFWMKSGWIGWKVEGLGCGFRMDSGWIPELRVTVGL